MAMNGTTITGNYTALYARTNYVVRTKGEELPSHTLTVNLKYKSGIIVYANGREIYRQYVKDDDNSVYAGGTNKNMVEKTIIIPSDVLELYHQSIMDKQVVVRTDYTVTVGVELHKYNGEEGSFNPRITFENKTYPITRFNNGKAFSSNNISDPYTGECVNIARSVGVVKHSGITKVEEIEIAFNENDNFWNQTTSDFPVDRPFVEFSLKGNPTTVLTHFGYVFSDSEYTPKSIELYGMNSNGKYEIINKDSKNHLIKYKKESDNERVIFGLPDNTKIYTSYRIVMVPQLNSNQTESHYSDIRITEFLMYSCKEVMCPRYLDFNRAKSGVCLNNMRKPLYNYGNTQTCCSIDGKWHNFYDKSKNEEISNFKYPKSVYNVKENDTMTILPSYKGVVRELFAECKSKNGTECKDLSSSSSGSKIVFDSKTGSIELKDGKLPVDTYLITVKDEEDDEDTVLTTLTIIVTDGIAYSDCQKRGAWPNAMKGERIRLECVDGTIGYRYRTCLENGKWSEIDKSNCKNNFTLVATKEMSYIRRSFRVENDIYNFDDLFDLLRLYSISKSRTKLLLESPEGMHYVNPNDEDVILEYIKPSINKKRALSSEIDVRLTLRVYPYHEISDSEYFKVYREIIKNITGEVSSSNNNRIRILQSNDDEEVIVPTYPPTNFTYKDNGTIRGSGYSFEFVQNKPFTLDSEIEFSSCLDGETASCENDIKQVTYLVKTGKLPFEITLFSNGTISGKLSKIESGNVTIEATFKETKLEFVFIYSSYGCKAERYWPASPVDTLVTLPCFDNFEGEMNRTCDKNGDWKNDEVSSCKDPGVILRPSSNEVFLKFTLESNEEVFKDNEFKNLYRTKVSELSRIKVNQFLYESVSDKSAVLIVNSTKETAPNDKTAVENVIKNDDATQAVKDVNEKYTYVHVTYTGFQQVNGYRKRDTGNNYNSATIAAIVLACVFGFIGVVVICFLCCQIGHFSKALSSPKK